MENSFFFEILPFIGVHPIPPYLLVGPVVIQGPTFSPLLVEVARILIETFLSAYSTLHAERKVSNKIVATSINKGLNVGPLKLNVGPFVWLI